MNENLNLVEILKDCPRGTKLYSIMWGEVELEKLNIDRTYPIVVKTKTKQSNREDLATFTSSGMWSSEYNGECMLFPSKDQRDWSKFNDGIKAADAEPNLKSLWHDVSEEPQGDEWHIAYIDVFGSIHSLRCPSVTFDTFPSLAKFAAGVGMQCWAYISDLLPKGDGK